jgi:sugar phosphate isomerase/epimerase
MIQRILYVLPIFLAACFTVDGQSFQLGMATSLENDSLLYASGFQLTGTTVESLISPTLPDSLFSKKLEQIRKMKCSIFMCNVLFPGSIKIAGPEVEEPVVLDYLESVLQRAKEAGVKNLILGSGGARRLPDGYDQLNAKDDFVPLARKMAELAQQFEVRIILENLNSGETNFLTRLQDAADVVRRVDHPNFRLNADIYHMMRENESPDEIVKAGNLIVYIELAELEGRTLPGVHEQDFTPYFRALKKIKYSGPIMIEGRSENLDKDVPVAFEYLSAQLREVYSD